MIRKADDAWEGRRPNKEKQILQRGLVCVRVCVFLYVRASVHV